MNKVFALGPEYILAHQAQLCTPLPAPTADLAHCSQPIAVKLLCLRKDGHGFPTFDAKDRQAVTRYFSFSFFLPYFSMNIPPKRQTLKERETAHLFTV